MATRAKPDPLATYKTRRDFQKTDEPKGKRQQSPEGNRFIVQKHEATRLHWDFRLEVEGVLKSWAVTRGPSLDPDDKRLAVRTEDHPLSYAEFEGVIPKGEYGGGTVMLWDSGTWEPIAGKSARDLEDGHLHFILKGERMKGEWLLVRMKPRLGEKRENWLLRKIDDEHAAGSGDLVERVLSSVLTGRSMAEIAADKKAAHSLKGKKGDAFAEEMARAASHNQRAARPGRARKPGKPPAFTAPQLATLVDAVPAGDDWFHEIKFDGYRAQIAVSGEQVRVYTRSGLDWTDKFGPLVKKVAALGLPPALIDGEITAAGADGNPSFSALQNELKRGHGEQKSHLDFHAFDLLALDGEDLRHLANIERKERLAALLAHAEPPIRVADHVIGAGEKLYDAMCKAGVEGVISKRIDAPYRGTRNKAWVKIKCTRRQDFVVIGWAKSSARARPFASLYLAQYADKEHEGRTLVYKGKVGTGFDNATLAALAAKMKPLVRDKPAAEVPHVEARGATWIEPRLVAEIAFAEMTQAKETNRSRVRHASFLGIRTGKQASPVKPVKTQRGPGSEIPDPDARIKISSRERVVFPESGQTKGQLADYFAAVGPLMLPHMTHRPISLVRCPQGRAKKCFFQKHDSGTFGADVHHVPIRERDGGTEDYLYVKTTAGILSCVQMGTIEFHGWASHARDVEAPDRMIFDLDPDEGLDFGDVKQASFDLHDRLTDLGLVTFAMLSGGKGVHLVVPLTPGHSWDVHKDFAWRFAAAMSLADPDRFVATMSKAKRKGKIFIDYLRNQRGSTAVMPYSARAREGAPVAVPVTWEELKDIDSAREWSIDDAAELIERANGKGLEGWGFAAQTLPEV